MVFDPQLLMAGPVTFAVFFAGRSRQQGARQHQLPKLPGNSEERTTGSSRLWFF